MIVAVVLGVGLAVPPLLRLQGARASVAASIWLSALVLRAMFVVFASAYLLAILPGSAPFENLSSWCWNATLPLTQFHLGLSGALAAQAAVLLPLVLVAAWASIRAAKLIKAHFRVARFVTAQRLGSGPEESVIIGGDDVMLAAAGLVRPEVVLTAGALAALDDAELAAGIAHEHGHIARHHRWWMALAEILAAVARPIPGTSHALGEFRMHLERDADRWAVDRTRDPLALASAICKSADRSPSGDWGALTALNGSAAVIRVDQLLEQVDEPRKRALAQKALGSLALLLGITATAFVLLVPSATAAGIKHLGEHSPALDCRF